MPELPEVETVRAGLVRHVLHRPLAAADVLHPRAVRHQAGGASELHADLQGRAFRAAVRRGKFLWLELEEADRDAPVSPDHALMVHLGMSGQLLIQPPASPGTPHAATALPAAEQLARPVTSTTAHVRVRLRFVDGGQLWFVDQRTFGYVRSVPLVATDDHAPGGQGSELPLVPLPAAHIARDLLDPAIDVPAVIQSLRARRTEIKRAILDQALVSGIGNIYADEALWRAELHGTERTDLVPAGQLAALLEHARAVMSEALAAGGTSFDAMYVDVDGAGGYFERSLDAYGRAGQPCRRCGTAIRREQFMNRGSFSCPACQPPPHR